MHSFSRERTSSSSMFHIMCNVCPQVIETRMNSMFELATQDEIDKLRAGDGSETNKSSEELQLDDLEV